MDSQVVRARWRSWRWQLAVVAVVGLSGVTLAAWPAFGGSAQGDRRYRMEHSPQWKDGHFENPQPLYNDAVGAVTGMFHISSHASPEGAVPTVPVEKARFDTPPASGLRVTWLGHSAILVEVDGHRVLTDPEFSDRASPLAFVGPSRWFKPLITVPELPPLDAVVISHDHYDHLDKDTIVALKDVVPRFIVPLGVGAHLESWGVPLDKIVELDWWEHVKVRELDITCTPARHASGRTLWDKDATLWAGYALVGSNHRVYFSGDTGLFPAMKEIGARLGPFDLTMVETGQYHRSWPDWHIGPEQAVTAHQWVGGRVMLPIHWSLFALAFHGWTEPGERVLAAAAKQGVTLALPRPGEAFEAGEHPEATPWWPKVPWETVEAHPIVSTGIQ